MNKARDNELARLESAAATKQADLDASIAVGSAEGVVRSIRLADLAAEHNAARRRLAAARGQVTKAMKAGAADKIAAANARAEQAYHEYNHIADDAIDQSQKLIGSGLANLGHTLDRVRPAWDAGSAVTEHLARPVDGGRA